MPRRQKGPRPLQSWLMRLFRQPPQGFYCRPAIYQSGSRMEIEHFVRILSYDEDHLCIQFQQGRYTVFGEHLKIISLTRQRITLYGMILRTDYSSD